MTQAKIILKASLHLLSPLQIGSGRSDNSDKDVLLDAEGRPFIPASSFIGKLNAQMEDAAFSRYIGIYDDKVMTRGENTQSRLIVDDLLMEEAANYTVSIRDGIRINNETGIVEDGAKFDYQVVEPGISFALFMEFDVLNKEQYEHLKAWIAKIIALLKASFYLGARSSSGSGDLRAKELKVMCYDLSEEAGVTAYLLQKELPDCAELNQAALLENKDFSIEADFNIAGSLIVRSYPKDPIGSDAIHLHSNGKAVLPGNSLRGALRARALRILNLLWDKGQDAEDFISLLFGTASTDKDHPYTVVSSLRVNEVEIQNVVTELQNRIKIDRFTGGTIESALFDSMPLFPSSDEAQIQGLKLSIKEALPSQKGLLLLLFKDLYHQDLAIGGEKNVGRGCLLGKKNCIWDDGKRYDNVFEQDDVTKWDEYIQDLVDKKDMDVVKQRLEKFMPIRGGKDASNH